MALIKRCCCCSLETGTKLIGFLQFFGGLILVVLLFARLVYALIVRDLALQETVHHAEWKKYEDTGVNITELEREEVKATAKIDYAYVIIILIVALLYGLFSTLMGALLLVGVYKGKLNFVKWWIKIKVGLVLLAVGWVLLQLLLLLFNLDAELTSPIIHLVYDGCVILVVNSYYDEESDKSSNADFTEDNFNNALPPPAYC